MLPFFKKNGNILVSFIVLIIINLKKGFAMKKAFILLFIFILLICGCNAGNQLSADDIEPEITEPVSESAPEPEPIPEPVQELIPEPEPEPKPTFTPPPRPATTRGTRPYDHLDAIRYAQGNRINSGIVTEDDQNIYFSNHNDRASIYVYNKQTQNVRKLEGTYHAAELHLRGEYIYYLASNDEAGFYTYRIRKDGSGREQVFEDKGPVLRYPQNEGEPYFMHLFPDMLAYRLDLQTGEKSFVLGNMFIYFVTNDYSGKMWYYDNDYLILNKLFEVDTLSDNSETIAIDVSAQAIRDLQYLDGYVYYRESRNKENGVAYMLNTQTREEAVIIPGNPIIEERVNSDNSVSYFVVPGAADLKNNEMIGFSTNLLVTDEYIFSSVFMPSKPNETDMRIIRVCRDTLEIRILYDNMNEEYGPTAIGIADGKIFFSTSGYSSGIYEFTKVMDLEGNRLDRQFGLVNNDTPA
jgi:hypothetical protein